ncbi:thiamine phosphate synthase [Marinobacterium sediminicola]|uniref:Thiamine-phosphate synthase n=1 Tax=Marinobacterium sediminicola TaxID=518898 RepID=A0ABY1S4B6_9GAMM|nr:thiamine phosphate synthase [Marinobacterium sediminicola]ULG68885.1 thiamine phosphate synthase [Marinobacterium sediminicola]SMR77913.1 thiamine-phosphate pyrophosphorylase [Marinobacterium sediminicola]
MTRLHGLYGLTDAKLMPTDIAMLEQVEAALKGGMRLLQYRDKSHDHEQRLRQARALLDLCRQYDCPLLINDDVELAQASGADGVHLGQQDGCVAAAREYLGKQALIGQTCHDRLELAHHAIRQGADHVAFGAFFPSLTKPGATPAPLGLLQEARAQLDVPVVAIGGISVDNAATVIEAGADLVAVVHALFAADDIERQANRFAQQFQIS